MEAKLKIYALFYEIAEYEKYWLPMMFILKAIEHKRHKLSRNVI